ncbi:MAG: sarcosine oxidase subunit alpha family protein [Alphaproteobacteria bacterium]|nr:sarcosine oxidase subunit alpha family protein [Alphaproteobacteria bacterium]
MSHRLSSGGRIDRSGRLRFSFDGRSYVGHPGDTLASALLANGARLVGRSFKYHRPRGVLTAGPEEPSALVELRAGARREANVPMPVVELFDGLEARSQNRWPSLAFDILSVNSLLSRFLPAGFYYKTFMWPAAFWEKVYEPLIRRSAGLGSAAREADPDHYETRHAHCDVLVVGSGPAGLAAARVAADAGARVILCEQDFELGGGLLLDPAQEEWRAATVNALARQAEVTLLPRTAVFGYYDSNVLGAVERVADHLAEPPAHQPRQRYWTIRAREVVLATGAHERLIAFPGNDRPGVMLAGAALAYLRRFAVAAGRRAVVFTNNDEAYDTALALREAGVEIAAVIDVRPAAARADEARRAGIEVRNGSIVAGVGAGRGVQRVTVARRNGADSEDLAADLLCVSGGHSPAVELASQSRTPLEWSDAIAAFVPGQPVQRQRSAGAARGIFGIAEAADDGAAAGRAAAAALGLGKIGAIALPRAAARASTPLEAFWEVKASGKSFVDLQNDVTTEDIRLAHREGYGHIEHAKRYTTHSMATDQGKTGGLVGAAVLAEARGESIAAVGLPTYRPYASPVSFGVIAGHAVGKDFAPVRRTALHQWHVRHGARFMEAGMWMRPAYYPQAGEEKDAWLSVLREARAVRRAVGICDVSTLGKIDVQGRDAGIFLDRLYTNTFSTLPVGRARYGLMLREDGIVFDDGTTSRLADDHFFMTTTTANAARVLEHMEYHAQTVWPDLDVRFCAVTDHWASMSVAGPKARLALAKAVQGLDLANAAFPFMAVGDAQVAGCPVRVFRISFSGELAYEVATPAGFAEPVWEAIVAAGAEHGITPYGVEALGLLRIEKGHVAGAELGGHTTARDLGLERMLKKQGDFVGRVLAGRTGLVAAERPRLVGLRPVDPKARLRAGSHLVVTVDDGQSLGWVTSAMPSVELDCWIGLAMLSGGEAWHGKRLFAAFPLYNEYVEVAVTHPHHVDHENARVRA